MNLKFFLYTVCVLHRYRHNFAAIYPRLGHPDQAPLSAWCVENQQSAAGIIDSSHAQQGAGRPDHVPR
jgi:hypothetical protein